MQRSDTQPPVLDMIRRLLAPPVFTNDDSKNRMARGLHSVLLVSLLFVLPVGLLIFLTPQSNNTGGMLALMATIATPTIPLLLLKQGKVRLAAALFIFCIWVVTSTVLFVSSGTNTVLAALYIAVICMALLFLGWRASLFSITATLIYTLILSLVDPSTLPKVFTITPFASWMILCLGLALVLIPITLMYNALLVSLVSVKEQLYARELAEQQLRDNEARLRLISTVTSDYTFSTQLNIKGEWTHQVLSGAFEKITGYTPDEFIALGGWKAIVHPADFEINQRYRRILFENQPSTAELRIIRKDGQIRWVSTSASPVWDAEKQQIIAINGGVQDITARKEAETILQQNEERFRLISTVTSDYTFSSRINTEGGLQHTVLSGAFEKITGYTPDEFIAIGGWSTILHPDDRGQDKRDVDVLRENRPTTSEVRIIRKDGHICWVRVSAYPIWDTETKTLLGINGAVQDITARKQAEAALQENEKRYRMATELISDYAYAFDIHEDGTLTCSWVTEQPFKRLSGYDWDDPRAQFMLYHPDDALRARRDSERTARGEPTDGEYRIITATGEIKWIYIQRQPEWGDSKERPVRFYGAAQDITARKLAADALRESETRLRAVIDHLPDTIYVKDLEGRYLVNNVESLRRLGVASQNDALGKTDQDFFPPDLAAQWWRDCESILASGKPLLNQEVNFDYFEGTSWLSSSFIPLRNVQGEIMGLVVINRDITEQKLAQKALQESERRYRLTSELISDYAYAYTLGDDGTRTLTWITEQSFRRLTGYNSDEMRNKVEIYHPDDRDRVRNDVAKTMRGEATNSEYRIVTATGEVKWLHVVRQVEWDSDKTRPIRYYGSATDITERKQAEIALLASEQRYRMTAELISDYAFAYDILPDGDLKLAWGTEQSYKRVTGYEWKEFPTQPDLYHPDDRERLIKDRQRALDGDPINGEYRIVTATGEVKWVAAKRAVEWDTAHTRPLRFYGAITDITERKHAEIALQESEARLRALLDATTDVAFLMSVNSRILTANKPMAKTVGKPLEEIIGTSGDTFVSEEVYARRHAYFEEVTQTKQPVRWVDTRNGEYWDNTVYPVLSYTGEVESFAVFGRDITEETRLAAELQRYATQLEHMVAERTAELRRAKEQIEIILNNTRDAIALAQPNGDIQTRNPAFVAMFGEQVSRWIEGLLWTVSGEAQSDNVGKALINMLHSREGQRIETQITVDKNGEKDIDLMFIPVSLETESQQPGILVSAHDITQIKEMERFKARFVADAVHDLATPIAGLSTRLYLLKRSPEKLDVHIQALENQVEHFRDLLADLRTLSQLDRKQMMLDLQPVNIQQSITRVFDTYEPVALSKNQTLDLKLTPNLPDMQLDRRQIERVFLNLVSNAINYSPEGKPIRITVGRDANDLVFAVADEGIGISEEDQPHVFERFYRTTGARQTRSGGTGLGLAIVKEIIELHGGSVSVRSEPGNGSTFSVRLPIK